MTMLALDCQALFPAITNVPPPFLVRVEAAAPLGRAPRISRPAPEETVIVGWLPAPMTGLLNVKSLEAA